jgi:hypothetical protein
VNVEELGDFVRQCALACLVGTGMAASCGALETLTTDLMVVRVFPWRNERELG